jgi:hypothetical protein
LTIPSERIDWMNTKSLRTSVAAAMGGAVLVAGLLVGASFALAQDAEEPPRTAPTEESVDGDTLERGFGASKDRAQLWGDNLDELAEEFGTTLEDLKTQIQGGATLEEIAAGLGINLDDVLAQLRAEALAHIDQAVEDGTITREQGDAIKERVESFDPGEEFPFGSRGFRGAPPEGFDLELDGFHFGEMHGFGFPDGDLNGILKDLDFDFEELKALLESGMTLDEALESLDVDLDAMLTDARDQALAKIDELVAEEMLTQEMADSIKEMIEDIDLSEGLPFGIGRFGFGMDMEDFDFEGFDFGDFDIEGFDFEGFEFKDFDLKDFDFDGFRGPRGHGHGFDFFGNDGSTGEVNADEAVIDA